MYYDDPSYLFDTTYTTYGSSSSIDGVAASMLASYFGGFMFALFVLWIFTLLIRWKMFEKAGVAGWKSIIPIYGDYVEYTIVWEGKWFWFTLLAAVVGCIAFFVPFIGPIVAVAAFVFLEIISVVFYMQEAKAFGQDTGFALGLIFLPLVFKFFLGFDQDVTYRGPQDSPKYFGTIREQLPTGTAQPQQPYTYQQSYAQQAPTYAPAPAPVTTPATAPAPAPESDDEPEVAPTPEPAATPEVQMNNGAPVPRFDPQTGLPLDNNQ